MLNFLRKYQKVVFGAVTAALIVSISFFGSYGAIATRPPKEEDSIVGTAIDGSNMYKLQMERMIRFLATDQLDTELMYKNAQPNLFNNGVIRRDFIETGLAQMLVESYFDDLKEDLANRLEKQKRFMAYAHPMAPFLSAENIWSQFLPSLHHNIIKVKAKDFELTPANFQVLADLYLESSKFPSSLLRRFLSYQESQYTQLMKDPYLAQGDLSLFYFHDLEDWFGLSFIALVSQCIHNGAIYAKQKGYKVGYEEAKADLLKQGYDALIERHQGEVTAEILDQCWKETLFALRLQEKQAVSIWQEVMLFRKMFDDYGQSVFLDKLSYDTYHSYTSECVEVERYTLPQEMQLGDFRSLLKFQVYLEAIAKEKKEALQLDLPKSLKTEDEIQRETPQLLERVYEVEMTHLTREEAAMGVSLKETWEWEAKPENWSQLTTEFKELATAKSTEDQLEVLDRLSDTRRLAVDQFARHAIVGENPVLMERALSAQSLEKKRLHIALSGKDNSLMGIQDSGALSALLQKVALEDEQASKTALENYTQDGEHYYRIYITAPPTEVRLLSFKEASSRGVLDMMLDEQLKKHHLQAQAAQPVAFQNEDGSFKEFASVKDQIGRFVYKNLLEEIEKDLTKQSGKLKGGMQKESLDFYATHRFYHFVQSAKEDIARNGSSSVYLDHHQQGYMEAHAEVVQRKTKAAWTSEEIFSMEEQSLSPISVAPNGEVSFYKVLKKSQQEDPELVTHIQAGQQLLAADAKRQLMHEVLMLLASTDSIHLAKIIEKQEVVAESL